MYEDSWYNYIPELQQQQPQQRNRAPSQSYGHKRRESLLQQPNVSTHFHRRVALAGKSYADNWQGTTAQNEVVEDLEELLEEDDEDTPPEPTLSRRAQSFSDFYDIVRAELAKDAATTTAKKNKKSKSGKKDRNWDALALTGGEYILDDDAALFDAFQDELLDAGQQEYTLYEEQLSMTERHLETLIEDTNSALKLLASLSESFRGVEEQTTTFQSQCEDLLSEQRRLEKLADEVGTDLHYYAYIDNVTRRLNAPGAGRQVEDESFGETMQNLDACIAFMEKNVSVPQARRGRETCTDINSLLTETPSPIWQGTSLS